MPKLDVQYLQEDKFDWQFSSILLVRGETVGSKIFNAVEVFMYYGDLKIQIGETNF